MADNASVTQNLTKVYGKLTAVDHVTLSVASGTGPKSSVIGFTARNGGMI